jgi:hypothetical protein
VQFSEQTVDSNDMTMGVFSRIAGLMRILAGILFFVLLHNHGPALGGPFTDPYSLTLTWDPSPSPDVAGYHLYYGAASGEYTNNIVMNDVMTVAVSGLSIGVTYYFALTAVGTDGDESAYSNEVSYAVPLTNAPPIIALTAPADSTEYTAPVTSITLAASVTSNGHTISKVQFYDGTTLVGEVASEPYSLIWSNGISGSHSLMARAFYDAGSTIDSSPVNINVTRNPLMNNPPIIALTAPADLSQYTAPATITLAARVTSNGNAISKVQFYDGTNLWGEAASEPYSLIRSNVSAGNYSLVARAIHDAGRTTDSSVANIQVTDRPRMHIQVLPGGQIVLTVTGSTGHTYDIEAAQDSSAWIVIGTKPLEASGSFGFTNGNAADFPQRFYRAREIP